MNGDGALTFLLLAIWGAFYALTLQTTRLGRFLAYRMTWASVVIGVGVVIIIAAIGGWSDKAELFKVFLALGASAIGIIARSVVNEIRMFRLILRLLREQAA